MLLYLSIRTLVAPYNNAVAPVNDPLPLNTLVIHDTVMPDFPYNVLPPPGMTPSVSKDVDSSKIAVVIPDPWKALESMLVTVDGIVMDVRPVAFWKALPSMLVHPTPKVTAAGEPAAV